MTGYNLRYATLRYARKQVTYLDNVVAAVAGEAPGAADGVIFPGAVEAVVVAIQVGVRSARLEEPRAEKRPKPRRCSRCHRRGLLAQLHAHKPHAAGVLCSLIVYPAVSSQTQAQEKCIYKLHEIQLGSET